jgi:membrane-associated phospholipid phosphatase
MAHTAGLIFACVLGAAAAAAQQSSSPEPPNDNSTTTQAVAPEPLISPRQFATNILHDQKPIWTLPWKAVKGKHWKPVLVVVLATGGLVVADPHIEPYFHNESRFGSYKTGPLRGRNSTLAVTLTPVAFYLAGLAKHSSYARNTGLLAAEGLIDTQLVSFVMKNAMGRLTPSDIPPQGNLRDTWFKYRGSFTNRGGFPSGHTASAFAVATVISGRYREHRWVPLVAYGAATFLSLTRLPTQAHFPSDIFLGAAMGYGIGRFVVLGR